MSEAPRKNGEGPPANTKGTFADFDQSAAHTDEGDRNVLNATLPSLTEPEHIARRAAMHSGRHPAGRHLSRPRPAPGCIGCDCETGGRVLPGFFHDCARSLPTRLTLAQDFRALVDNGGQGYQRDLLPHERADFALQKADLELDGSLDEAWAEVEPTDDFGMDRRFLTVDDEDGEVILQNWMRVTGANARKWVTL